MLSTSDLAMYKAGALQHHHVLRNCVEGDREGPRDLANCRRLSRKTLHARARCWISDCRKDIAQMLPRTWNHMLAHERRQTALPLSFLRDPVLEVPIACGSGQSV